MFDTRHLKVNTLPISREELTSRVVQEVVFEHYSLPLNLLGTRFCSPFRKDTHPDCKLYYNKSGKLLFYDPSAGLCLDLFDLVGYVEQLDFVESMQHVYNHFLDKNPDKKSIQKAESFKVKAQSKATIQIRACEMDESDLAWWGQYNISPELLFRARVWSISDYWLNGRHHYCPKGRLSFCYKEDDGYKLYFPEEEKRYKWLGTTKVLACYELLPQTGDLLVITSSKKDALNLISLGYNAIAPQGEGVNIPSYQLWELKQRFKRVVLFYDNDAVGLCLAHEKWKSWEVDDYVFIPVEDKAKDPSDYCKLHGVEAEKTLLNELLKC